MKRRSFLKTLASAIAGVAISASLKPVPPMPVQPRGLAYLVNQHGMLAGLSRSTYPELKAPVLDAHGGPITLADLERVAKKLKLRYQSGNE